MTKRKATKGGTMLPNLDAAPKSYPKGTVLFDQDGLETVLDADTTVDLDNYPPGKKILYLVQPDADGTINQELRNEADAHVGDYVKKLEMLFHDARTPNEETVAQSNSEPVMMGGKRKTRKHKRR
jgi:ketosteroid isomerase-like protein